MKPYKLKFMFQHPRVQVCSGCKRKFAKDPGNKPPPPPHDLIIRRQEYPQFVEQHTGILRTGRLVWVSYHVSQTCIKAKNPAFTSKMVDYAPVVPLMSQEHETYIHSQLNIAI